MSQGAGLGNLLIFALPVLLIVFMFMTQRRRQREVAGRPEQPQRR